MSSYLSLWLSCKAQQRYNNYSGHKLDMQPKQAKTKIKRDDCRCRRLLKNKIFKSNCFNYGVIVFLVEKYRYYKLSIISSMCNIIDCPSPNLLSRLNSVTTNSGVS